MTAVTCLVCNSPGPFREDYIPNIFDVNATSFSSDRKILDTLCEILETQLEEENVHTKRLCTDCYKICTNYDMYKTKYRQCFDSSGESSSGYECGHSSRARRTLNVHSRFTVNVLKTKLCKLYQTTQEREKSLVQKPSKEVSPKKSKAMFVVPASKLHPLPADYQLNLGKIAAMTSTKVSKPLLNLKMTIGNSVLTQSLTTSTVKIVKPSDVTNIDIGEWSVNGLPSEIFSANESENGDNAEMEIGEECNVVPVSESENTDISVDISTIKTETPDGTRYIDTENFELLLDGEEENDGQPHTIVLDSNSSILQMMSGQKLVYENGQLSLVMDENDDADDDVEPQDSNDDESQIELQVSGDEETANAIIAAAQEKGGAFIKVESGEMYRVKSVQSKPSDAISPDTATQLVAKDGDKFKCLVCDNLLGPIKMTFTADAHTMVKHMKTEHAAKIYICSLCGIIMRNRSEYTTHIAEHTKKNPQTSRSYACPDCGKRYNSRTLLREHSNVHSGVKPHACHICGKAFASKYTRKAHLKTHQVRPRPFKCPTCGKSFLSQQNLTQHEKTHLGIKSFVCNICNKAFGTQHSLEVHGVVHSGRKPHVCPVCDKAFARRAELADHARIHTGERPFECEVCGAKFSQRSNLHSHRRATHFDDKRHSCPDCPKRFKRRRLLQYHIKAAHTGERPLQCEVCHSTFVYPEHYKKHIRIHNGERPYYCEICGKAFNSRDNRNTHRFVHSDKKPYECLACGASYMRKRMLVAHMNAHGHLAESIVVNQPRVTKVNENLLTEKIEADFEEEKNEDDNIEVQVDENGKLYTINEEQSQPETPIITTINSDGIEPPQVRFIQVKMPNGQDGWVALND